MLVLHNGYGKVSGVHETWTMKSSITRWASDGDDARTFAIDMLDKTDQAV